MKKIVFIFVCFAIFVACKKKAPHTYCYSCNPMDSISSNVPAFATGNVALVPENHCNITDAMKNALIKQNTTVDTVHRGDTLLIHHRTYTCDLNQ